MVGRVLLPGQRQPRTRRIGPVLALWVLVLGLASVVLGAGKGPVGSSLIYFTTSPSGSRSMLWRAALDGVASEASGDTLAREPLLAVNHAPGFQPRGILSESGIAAWLELPDGRGVGDPAELVSWRVAPGSPDPVVVDGAALYLQRPAFLEDRLFYLRGKPAQLSSRSHRTGQALWTFSLLEWEPNLAEPRLLYEVRALWVLLVGFVAADSSGAGEDLQPVLLEIHPNGPVLVELSRDGEPLRRWHPGSDLLLRDIEVAPDTERSIVFLAESPSTRTASFVQLDLDTGAVTELRSDLGRDSSPRLLPGSGEVLVTEALAGGGRALPQYLLGGEAVLYRVQDGRGLSWFHGDVGGFEEGRRLVPEGDEDQDVSLLGVLP